MECHAASHLFVTPPPPDAEAELRAVVAEKYGAVVSWQSLGGEDDLNVRVELPNGAAFLKASWVDDSGFADFQTRMIDHLSAHTPRLPVPTVIPALDGSRSVVCERNPGRDIHLRVTTFLPGIPARGVALSDEVLHAIGRILARLDDSLADMNVTLPERQTNWNIMAVGDALAQWIPAASSPSDGDRRAWAAELDHFVAATLPRLEQLPHQIIHNDLNGSNVLIDPETGGVTGLFDFGDVAVAPRVVDLAIAAAYLVDGSSASSLFGSLSAIVAGYQCEVALGPDEIAMVPSIMRARYAMALTLNSARAAASDDPGYVQYVLRNSAASRQKLAALSGATSNFLARHLVEMVDASVERGPQRVPG